MPGSEQAHNGSPSVFEVLVHKNDAYEEVLYGKCLLAQISDLLAAQQRRS